MFVRVGFIFISCRKASLSNVQQHEKVSFQEQNFAMSLNKIGDAQNYICQLQLRY